MSVINSISPNITKIMLVINSILVTKTFMEFKATSIILKNFLNKNLIEWEIFFKVQLNYEKRKKKECLNDNHR